MSERSNIFFTSDTHFNHANIIKTRPHFQNEEVRDLMHKVAVEPEDSKRLHVLKGALSLALLPCLYEMTEVMTYKWNAFVKPGDRVFHLGDFGLSWGKRRHGELMRRILGRLNGVKHLVIGNHDREEVTRLEGWNWVKPYYELKVPMGGVRAQRICLFHYAQRTWNQMHRGAWMLHGHSHGNLPDIGGKTFDVGVDCHGFAPVSLEEVTAIMSRRPVVTPGDHHQ